MGLAELRRAVAPVSLARERTLPVLSPLEPLLPDGVLERGIIAGLSGPGSTSLALALAAGPSEAESWVAAVGLRSLGYMAAAGYGVGLDRLAVVAQPEPSLWADVVAALVDSLDVVLVAAEQRVRSADARRLRARVRDRGAVLIQVGRAEKGAGSGWPERPDLEWSVVDSVWDGLDDGAGHLQSRRVTVEATGRRGAARVRRAELWLPGPEGRLATVEPRATVIDIGQLRSGEANFTDRVGAGPSDRRLRGA